MPGALDVVTGQGTAIGATLAALTAATGDSFAVKSFPEAKAARILAFWADVQVAGTGRIRSARMHDNVQAIRFDTIISDPRSLMPRGASQRLYPNDVLVVELAGSAVAGDIEFITLLIYYEDLPGVSGNFITAEQALARIVNLSFVENTIATGTAGGYSGSEAINVEFDQFRAGEKYALLGYLVDTECDAVCWRGPDTGNLRVGGPGDETERSVSAEWFLDLSRQFNLPLVPVISAENKTPTAVDAVQDENGADVTLTSIFAQLAR